VVLRGGGAGVWEWHGVPKRCTRPINRFRPVGSGGRLPSGTKIGEGGYHGETFGAELEDLAYKGLGGTVPPHIAGQSAHPLVHTTRYAFLTGVVTIFLPFLPVGVVEVRQSVAGRRWLSAHWPLIERAPYQFRGRNPIFVARVAKG